MKIYEVPTIYYHIVDYFNLDEIFISRKKIKKILGIMKLHLVKKLVIL